MEKKFFITLIRAEIEKKSKKVARQCENIKRKS